MASREELLQSINPEMTLDQAFFMKVYGYEISFPGFADIAIKALEDAGCSMARSYYNRLVGEYEQKKQEELYPVAVEYVKQLERQWEKQKRSDNLSKEKKLTKSELTELCLRLLEEGIIQTPEQLLTMAL